MRQFKNEIIVDFVTFYLVVRRTVSLMISPSEWCVR